MNQATREAELEALVTRLAPSIRTGFLASIDRIRNHIKRRELVALLKAGNTYGALRLIDEALAAEPFRPFQTAVSDAIMVAGRSAAQAITAAVIRKREWGFQPFNAATAQVAQTWIGRTVTYLSATARAAALAVMLGISPERKPGSVADEVLGSLGLTERQVKGAQALRAGMERERQERIAEAVRAGEPERVRREAEAKGKTPGQVQAIVDRYMRRALRERGKFLASDQARRSASIATQRAWEQAAEDGLVDAAETIKRWVHVGDDRVRNTHRSIPALQPEGVPLYGSFRTAAGNLIRYPHDPDAPLEEVAGCRCSLSYRAKVLR